MVAVWPYPPCGTGAAADEGGYQGSKWGRGEGRRREMGCVVGAGRGVPSVCMCEMDAYMGRVRACVRGCGPGGRSLASVVFLFLPPSPRARALATSRTRPRGAFAASLKWHVDVSVSCGDVRFGGAASWQTQADGATDDRPPRRTRRESGARRDESAPTGGVTHAAVCGAVSCRDRPAQRPQRRQADDLYTAAHTRLGGAPWGGDIVDASVSAAGRVVWRTSPVSNICGCTR